MPPAQPDRVEVRVQRLSVRTTHPVASQIIRQLAIRTAVARSGAMGCVILSCLLLAVLLAVGCGAPGMPTPPSPPIPTAVTDLTAQQSGDGALLSFTLPGKTITGKRLTETPSCEIFRGMLKPD